MTTGVAFMSYLSTFGCSAPLGSSFLMRSIFSRTSVAITSTSRSPSNSRSSWQKLFAHVAVTCFRPFTCVAASSSFFATDVSISSGDAPG